MELPEFDKLVKMAEQQPEEFEKLREMLIENAISAAQTDNQRRLRGLQFQIDMVRSSAKTPMAACIRISALMHESLAELRHYLNNPFGAAHLQTEPPKAAQVISIDAFKTRSEGVGIAQ